MSEGQINKDKWWCQGQSKKSFVRTKNYVDRRFSLRHTIHYQTGGKMIVARESIKEFISSQKSVEELAEKIGVVHSTLYSVVKGNNVSSEVVAKLLTETGFDFEKAFEVKE